VDFVLYEAVLNDERITQVESNVLRYIIFRCNSKKCFFGQAKAAKQLKICTSRLSEAITWLRDSGYIRTDFNGKCLSFEVIFKPNSVHELSPQTKPAFASDETSFRPGRDITSIEQASNSLKQLDSYWKSKPPQFCETPAAEPPPSLEERRKAFERKFRAYRAEITRRCGS